MIFEVDINKLVTNGISINEYLFLQFVENQDYNLFINYINLYGKFFNKDSIDLLLSLNFIEFKNGNKYVLSNFKITDTYRELFKDKKEVVTKDKVTTSSKVEEWISEWQNLWPKGIKSGGYLVRSGLKDCLVKMKKFKSTYPEYDKDTIIKATISYIENARMNNYKFMQLAHYFIFKNGMSTLASNCELIKDGGEVRGGVDYIEDI